MLRILAVKDCDITNGPGIRLSLWFSGCNNHCEGCFSKNTWNPLLGKPYTQVIEDNIFKLYKIHEYDGVSILGGDPLYHVMNNHMEESKTLLLLLRRLKENNINVWLWSGYTFEDIPKGYLKYIDVLVDGKFQLDKKDVKLKWKGSSNQRIIDVQKSLGDNKIQLLAV